MRNTQPQVYKLITVCAVLANSSCALKKYSISTENSCLEDKRKDTILPFQKGDGNINPGSHNEKQHRGCKN